MSSEKKERTKQSTMLLQSADTTPSRRLLGSQTTSNKSLRKPQSAPPGSRTKRRCHHHQHEGGQDYHQSSSGRRVKKDTLATFEEQEEDDTGVLGGDEDNMIDKVDKENRPATVAAGATRTLPPGKAAGSGRPGSVAVMRGGAVGASRASSRASLSSAKRTIPRSAKSRQRSRPQSVSTVLEDGASSSRSRHGGSLLRVPGANTESDTASDADAEIQTRKTMTSDMIDFGQADIFADQGWDTDLDVEVEDPRLRGFDHSGKTVYLESCKQKGVVPVSYFLRHMYDSELEMKHHGLGENRIKPICVCLVSNTTVTKLDVQDNWLGDQGGTHVCEMLKENCYITDLDLSDNRLGYEFAKKFIDVLIQNSALTHVTLSGNEFNDQCAVPLADAIMSTSRLEYLCLSRNKLAEGAGIALGPAISENSSIKHLDLSWNSIRRRGAVAIANGVKTNVLMQKLNLSWNGVGVDGCKALGEALKVNASLEELDLTNNRLTTEGAVLLGKGLAVSESLKRLKIGKNPLQSSGCYALCAALLKNPNTVIEELDFSDILVNNDFLACFQKLKEQLPDVRMRHGGDELPKRPKARVHPMVKLKNYIDRNNLRLVDFFNKFDTDNSMSVTREEFAQGIEEIGIELTDEEIELLLDDLDENGDGEICYSEMVMGHQAFTEREKKTTNTIMDLLKN